MSLAAARLSALPLAALALATVPAVAARIDPGLLAQARADGRVEVLLVMADQERPLLAPLAPDADYRVRREALVEALRDRAGASQAGLVQWLSARGAPHRPYWIRNVVWAELDSGQLSALARRSDVARVAANPHIPLRLPPPVAGTQAPAAPAAVAWGVAMIDAPAVWAAGYDGQGVVIAGQDTGYQWDHPALKAHYRGWDGSIADHDYNWHDAIHEGSTSCGIDSPFPCDDWGHGTHTAGTFAGGDGGVNQIGVAPGAKWIGCRNMGEGDGTPARYIECMQWLLAPTDLAGDNPRPDLAPDIVSNSWTCIPSEGCTVGDEIAGAVDALVEAGIFFVAAAANDGSSCSTITSPPAIYDASFVVGATDSGDALADFSSRGPVAGSSLVRPDVSAPGVDVRSAVPTNGYDWMSGTSMATPHVAGAAALLMSVDPSLKGHPAEVAELLRSTAVREGVTDPYNSGCGGLTMADWPNYQAGYGRIDVYAAAVAAGLGSVADTVFEDGFDGAPGR